MTDENIQHIYPLTPLQEGILFHTIEASASNIYVTQVSCQLTGELDVDILQQAWGIVIERHAALRTLFTWEKRDKPLQIVRHRVDLRCSVLDWRISDQSTQQEHLKNFLRSDRECGFDLDVAPLMRLTLIILAESTVRMVWSFHHIVLDGWSRSLVFDESLAVYYALMRGNEHDLPQAPEFAKFVDSLKARDQSAASHFWEQRLRGFSVPTSPEIPRDVDHDGDSAGPGQIAGLRLDKRLCDRVRLLAQQQRVTLNTLIVAAWSVLLSRYCDSDDIVFGTTVAGRSAGLAGIDRMVGLFINTLPVRVKFGRDESLASLLRQIQVQQVEQQAFEQTPLPAIRRNSDIPLSMPLFNTILVFQMVPALTQTGSGELKVSDERTVEYSNFPLALLVVPDECIRLTAVFDTRRYSRVGMERLLRGLESILEELSTNAQPEIRSITAVPGDDRTKMLRTWNDTEKPRVGAAISVVHLFEKCVADFPHATAITTDQESVTYDVLNRQANGLARRMHSHAVVAGKPVIVFIERSADAVVGMLAALKAGAAYVPVDVNDPSNRLERVVSDLADAFSAGNPGYKPLLLTHSHLEKRAMKSGADVIVVNDLQPDVEQTDIGAGPDSTDLAYIIYTSGSTGKPKGVMMDHGALLNSTVARFEYYEELPRAFALLSSLATDSSLAGIYWTLCSGGNLIIPGYRIELDVAQTANLIETHHVTHMLCVPSLYALILEHSDQSVLSSLQVVIVAGESCNSSLVAMHHRLMPDTDLYNEYGPSEACVWASAQKLEDNDVTIGKPIANTYLYILDSKQRLVPIGVAGELYIGGANVAGGYVGNDEATSQAFLEDPYSEKARRMYRTGDRVRYREDGRLEFLGRIDQQLKIRGYRVEPGEIEETLVSHPQVDAAVVFVEQPLTEPDDFDELVESLDAATVRGLIAEIEAMDGHAVECALDEIDGKSARDVP